MARARKAAAPPTGGRERLVQAAVRLAARNGGLGAVGMRELAREAGLNPNTFYRHFADFDDLGVAAVEATLPALRAELARIRATTTTVGEAIVQSVRHFFDFAERQPEAIIVAWRELQGPSARLREAIGDGLRGLIDDMAQAIVDNRWNHRDDAWELADTVVRFLFVLSLDYVRARASERARIVTRAERYIMTLFAGATVVRALKLDPASPALQALPALLAGRH